MTKLVKPMLAGKYDPEKAKFPMWASYKIDGVRCLIKDGVALSRSMKPLPNKYVQAWAERWAAKLEGYDGELVVGEPTDPAACRETVSAIMRIEGEPKFTFYVFDYWNLPTNTYEERYARMEKYDKSAAFVTLLDNWEVKTEADVAEFLQNAEEAGYEGAMLRNASTFYKQGRSTLRAAELLKVKTFSDAEAEIVACHELMHNGNEAEVSETGHTKRSHKKEGMVGTCRLGSLEVVNEKLWPGLTFQIGTGFDAAQRALLWDQRHDILGARVKFKYFPAGAKERPRFPVFLDFRPDEDLDA